ncbi:MAG: prepilin-type N-terminal cleavage/methylation domain-containing protein [Candidatus Riflebacteria bacterium]|nr:prepilin-type N-terminal cleavage/methylation domain-containing protein [Candidatus Riflebacteria bacterium]
MNSRLFSTRRGFTAIELIIVVVIIGVLAAAGMTKYKDFTSTARKSSCLSNLEHIKSAVQLAENRYGALTSGSVIRFQASGAIDPTHLGGTTTANYLIWMNSVPPPWGPTNAANNDKVVTESQDARIFRCPEDVNNLGSTYTGISDLNTGKSQSADLCTYTFAKAGTTSAARPTLAFVPAIPLIAPATADPLEGYNWVTQPIEYKNSSLVFCRRYGLRNDLTTGTSGITASVATDVKYYPGGQERRLAHSSYAPAQ